MDGFWDIAYRDNAPALLGVLRRYVKDENIAQDLLHEVFITAIDKYDSYTGKGSFEGWLYWIAVNTALMYLRNEQKTVEMECIPSLQLAEDDDIDDEQKDGVRAAIEAAEFSDEELLAAIDRLPQHHKLVFNMYVMDDFSHKQIAAELNISPGTSKSHLKRARRKIQQFLYDDAMNRKKKKDNRRASAFLLLLTAKDHYIDRLYRTGLSDFTIPPAGGAEFLSAILEQHAASVAVSTVPTAVSVVSQTAFWGSKLSYIAVCCGTAAITGTVCWLSMSVNSPLNRDNDKININDDRIIVSDSLMYSPNPADVFDEAFSPSESVISESKETSFSDNPEKIEPDNYDIESSYIEVAPVVVRRQIIERQTVVVRDTIFIIENE
jgi:RNA polymerase sigma factor (sigma-70 family)